MGIKFTLFLIGLGFMGAVIGALISAKAYAPNKSLGKEMLLSNPGKMSPGILTGFILFYTCILLIVFTIILKASASRTVAKDKV